MQLNKIANAAISAFQIAWVARFLSAHDYGIYGIAFSTLITIQSIFDVRATELIIKYFYELRKEADERLAGCFLFAGALVECAVAVAVCLILVGLSLPFAKWLLSDPGLFPVFLVTALVPLSNIGSGIGGALISMDRSYGKLAIADTIATALGFLFLVIVVPSHPTPSVILLLSLFTQGLRTGVRWLILWKSRSPSLALFRAGWGDWAGVRALKPFRKRIFRNATQNNLLSLLKVAQGSVPTLLMARLQTPAEAAFYFLGQRIGARLGVLVSPIVDVAFRESAENRSRVLTRGSFSNLRKVIFTVGLVVTPVFLAFGPLGNWSIPLVFGDQYREGIPVIQLVVCSIAASLLFNPLGSLLIIEDKVHWVNIAFFLGFLLQLAAIMLLVPKFGSFGAALALAIFQFVIVSVQVAAGFRLWKKAAA